MKKMLFVLMVLLIAMPAMAAVTLTEVSKTGTQATVGYAWASGVGFPRAFALTLVANGGFITSVTATKTGVSTSASKGYGIFPGTIVINTSGVVTSDGTPVEPNALPGGGAANGASHHCIVALGSLYGPGDANKPASSGSLFTVVCSAGTTSVTVSEEDTYRGGVVDVNAVGLTVAPITITFPPSTFTLTTSAGTGGSVTVPGMGAFSGLTGSNTITAVASGGYHFVNWTGTGVTAGKVTSPASASTAILMDADYTAIANFAVIPPTLSGTVTLGLTSPREVGKTLSIQLVTAGGAKPPWPAGAGTVENLTTTLTAGGAYSVTCATAGPGTYDVYLKVSHWNRKKVASVVLVAGTKSGIDATLVNGDVNGSNAITSGDLGILKTNYLLSVPVGTLGDLNESGSVTSADLGILKTNYLLAGD